MIGVARNALLALLACLACLGPLAAQVPAVIDAAPVTAARIEAVAARHGMVVAQEGRAARIAHEKATERTALSEAQGYPAGWW